MPDRVAKVEEWELTVEDRVLKLPDSVASVPELVLTVDESVLTVPDRAATVAVVDPTAVSRTCSASLKPSLRHTPDPNLPVPGRQTRTH